MQVIIPEVGTHSLPDDVSKEAATAYAKFVYEQHMAAKARIASIPRPKVEPKPIVGGGLSVLAGEK
jgi:hypothetical protein